jgi:hypothetical protein
MLLVPQYLMYQKPPAGASAAEQEAVVRDWQQKLGYAFKEAPGGGGQKVAESADEYLRRLVGYVAMFGALVQVRRWVGVCVGRGWVLGGTLHSRTQQGCCLCGSQNNESVPVESQLVLPELRVQQPWRNAEWHAPSPAP